MRNKTMIWSGLRVVAGHGWAWFLTRFSLSSMCQCRIFARALIKKGEGEPGYEATIALYSLLGYITLSSIPSRNPNDNEPFSCCSTNAMSFLISEAPITVMILIGQKRNHVCRHLPSKRYCFILTIG